MRRIISDPTNVIARKSHETTAHSITLVKESIREIMFNADKKAQLRAFKNALLEISIPSKIGLPVLMNLSQSD